MYWGVGAIRVYNPRRLIFGGAYFRKCFVHGMRILSREVCSLLDKRVAVGRNESSYTVGERFLCPNSLSFVFIRTDDIQGWQDAVLKSLERKHRSEQEFLMSLLQDESSKGMREEARALSEDERLKRLNELKAKREELDFGVKGNL